MSSDDLKFQDGDPPPADGQSAGAIISPDTRRANRVPPGQSRTRKWPVLDASGTPPIDLDRWTFTVSGLVQTPTTWTWTEFLALPGTSVFGDFHCVTRWSRLGNLWTGVALRELLARCGGPLPTANFASISAYDQGWTTNLPLNELLSEDVLVATGHDGLPLSPEHGAPARLVVPGLYAWKSAKWIARIELTAEDRPGFWERNGYHRLGNPWREERFSE